MPKTDVLIVGYSSLVQRKVLPSLMELQAVGRVHIASRRDLPSSTVRSSHRGRVIAGYDRALAEVEPGLVYVSLPNSLHHKWCMRALRAGFHVVVDKPAFMNAAEATEVADLALRNGLCCVEATVWQSHPMLDLLARLKKAEDRDPVAAYACFSSPPLDEEDFRLDPAMGGGIIFDRASYAISCGRILYEGEPERVSCTVTERDPRSGLDLSCRITLQYPGGGFLDGFYSLKADYRNTLSVIGETYCVDFDRVFTPPVDYEGPAIVRKRGKPKILATPTADTFALFLGDVIEAIECGSVEKYGERLVRDAAIMDQIRDSATGERA